jgi:hypothetical protein
VENTYAADAAEASMVMPARTAAAATAASRYLRLTMNTPGLTLKNPSQTA